jgi:4'-phosphopantetheinyl transferase
MLVTRDVALIVSIDVSRTMYDGSMLDPHERARADRFIYERDRRRFVNVHSAMRMVLATQLAVPPRSLNLVAGEHGKPRVAGSSLDLRFNLSHSGERALLALTLAREVGVDIEQHGSRDTSSLARFAFSQTEFEALERLPPHDRAIAFYRGWTRKESFIKARGDGFSFPLDGFDVSLEADGPLLGCRAAPAEIERWTVLSVPVEPGYSAALTVEGSNFEMVIVDFSQSATRYQCAKDIDF